MRLTINLDRIFHLLFIHRWIIIPLSATVFLHTLTCVKESHGYNFMRIFTSISGCKHSINRQQHKNWESERENLTKRERKHKLNEPCAHCRFYDFLFYQNIFSYTPAFYTRGTRKISKAEKNLWRVERKRKFIYCAIRKSVAECKYLHLRWTVKKLFNNQLCKPKHSWHRVIDFTCNKLT